MLLWLLLSTPQAQEEPPPERAPAAPLSSGALLRALAEDAGFQTIIGEADDALLDPGSVPHQAAPPGEDTTHRAVPHGEGGPTHTTAPPGAGGQSAPGFALELTLPRGQSAVEVTVQDVSFTPRDDGRGEDRKARDGVWTAMIERYPPDQPLTVTAGGAVLFSGAIVLERVEGVPRMGLDLSR